MAASKTIIITAVTNCVGSVRNQVGVKLNAVNSVLMRDNDVAVFNKMVIPKSSSVTYTGCEDSQVSIPNRKRKLDHLTLEEKLHTKKLKNRVAAQSSRDRKRARLEELEAEVKALRVKNGELTVQCHNLNLEKTRLGTENEQLLQKLSNIKYNHQTHGVSCSTQVDPAEFSVDPLLPGQALQLAVPGASGFDCVDNPEVLPSLPDFLDSLDVDVCLSHLDEFIESLTREAAEEMDSEHSCSTQVDPAEFSIDPLLLGQALQLAVPGASGFDCVDNPEVLPSFPDLLDSLDEDVCLSHLDELAESLIREGAEDMDTEHRQASAEVGTYRFKRKSSCNKVVGSSQQ
jgi:hypothetical protein